MLPPAETGSGKTLSFGLPLIEKLVLSGVKSDRGRAPMALIMAPTRELARQIERELHSVAGTRLAMTCIYGGESYDPQERAMREGVDIVVGTPGRIMDHVNRGNLNLTALKYVILDEADRMLEVGFAEAVDELLGTLYESGNQPQTVLFSATMPKWVQETARKYLKDDKITINLIQNDNNKTSDTIRHLCIRSMWQERPAAVRDVVQVYSGAHGRAIIFCATKKEANELTLNAVMKQEAQVLHGDIPQKQREMSLQAFRDGKVQVLIATDVAARGLDIPEVDLVVQCEPSEKVEDYIHRSGRTGRAGKSGVSILFYKPEQEWLVQNIENKGGIKFKRVGAPLPTDIIKSAAEDARKSLDQIPESVLPHFHSAAQELINERGALDALAAALAQISGQTEAIQSRSLLNSAIGFTTMLMKFNQEIRTPSYIFTSIRNNFPEVLIQKKKKKTIFRFSINTIFFFVLYRKQRRQCGASG